MREKTNIYFIQREDEVKIGRSIDIERRLDELQIANSVELKLIYKIENVNESFEGHIHDVCERYHVRGEWFNMGVIEHLLKHPFFGDNMKVYSINNS